MSGKPTSVTYADGSLLPVVESFYSIQGEGFNTGKAAWFIRLGGCDVRCPWCDSKNTWNAGQYPLQPVDGIVSAISDTPAVNVILTGGEPLMHNLGPICSALRASGYNIFLETSGTHPLSGGFDWICLSPKKHRSPLKEVADAAHELKAVISGEDDLAWAEECGRAVNDRCLLYLQPEWGGREKALPLIIEYVKRHPRWRVSLQTHKFMNIP